MKFDNSKSILITGGAGFIGSELIRFLNLNGINNITILENDSYPEKWKNLVGLKYKEIIAYYTKFNSYQYIIHLGAHSNTTLEPNLENWKNNIEFSKILLSCPYEKFIFASSASIYGNNSNTNEDTIVNEKPNSFYAFTKKVCDDYIRSMNRDNIYSLRFFNVFGRNEGHKGDMASPIYRWLTEYLSEDKKIKLFRGGQARDFVWVGDICKIIQTLLYGDQKVYGGVYNCGTGNPQSWEHVAKTILKIRELSEDLIQYTEIPEKIQKGYQYNTKADMKKLSTFFNDFTPFEDSVQLINDKLKIKYGRNKKNQTLSYLS